MGIGGTAKKLQKLANMAETLYKQMSALRDEMVKIKEDLDRTSDRVDVVERKVDRQTALLEAMAREEGVDVEAVYEEAGVGGDPEKAAEIEVEEGQPDALSGEEGSADESEESDAEESGEGDQNDAGESDAEDAGSGGANGGDPGDDDGSGDGNAG